MVVPQAAAARARDTARRRERTARLYHRRGPPVRSVDWPHDARSPRLCSGCARRRSTRVSRLTIGIRVRRMAEKKAPPADLGRTLDALVAHAPDRTTWKAITAE